MQKGFISFLIILAVLILAGYAFWQKQLLQTNHRSTPTNYSQPTTKQKTTSFSLDYLEFRKRLFDPTAKFFKDEITGKTYSDQGYPEKLANRKEDELISIRCTPQFEYDYREDKFLYGKRNSDGYIQKVYYLDYPDLIAQAKKVVNNKQIDAAQVCQTEDKRTIFEYEIWGGGGGGKNVSYVNLYSDGKQLEQIVSIPTDGTPYFKCSKVLQLTKGGLLYYQCGGGDQGSSWTIYEIDLNKKTQTRLLKCTTVYDNKTDKTTANCN